MAETEDEKKARKAELAEAFADGLDLFDNRKAERDAKNKADEEAVKGEKKDDGNTSPNWRERLLGIL